MDPYLHYDLLRRTHRALALKAIIQERIKPGMRVLDAGCGSGILSIWAGQAGAEVVGVDLADISLARMLVEENGLAERVRIMQGDLFEVDLGDQRFDALLAMVYLNDPRRDEDRPKLVHGLKRFLKPGALMVPDRVRYTVAALDWPAQRSPARWQRVDEGIAEFERIYSMRMGSFKGLLRQRPNKSVFPHRGPDGLIDLSESKRLTPQHEFIVQGLRDEPRSFPDRIVLSTQQVGELNTLLFEQELLFMDTLIFRNQSISWVDPPVHVSAAQRVEALLDGRWRADNLVSAL